MVFVKHRDVPGLLADGVLDIGVTSLEWIRERDCQAHVLGALDWCDTRICLLVPDASDLVSSSRSPLRCVTEFPNLAARYFSAMPLRNVHITAVSGSTEGMVPSLFDCAIDCVETGGTAARHGLRIEAVVLESPTVAVVAEENPAAAVRGVALQIAEGRAGAQPCP